MDNIEKTGNSSSGSSPSADEWIAVRDKLEEIAGLSDAAYQDIREQVAEDLRVGPESLDTMRRAYQRQKLGDTLDDEKKKQADRLVALAQKNADLFHAPDGGGWADVRIDGRRETWFLKSRTFVNSTR